MNKISKIKISIILAFGIWLVAFAAQATEVREVESGGVKAWVVEDHILPIVAINIAFKNAGSAHDPEDKAGLGYLVASMLNEGAGEYSSRAYQKALEKNGIEFSPNLDKDNFYISVKTLSEHLPLAAKLTNLAITQPKFAGEDFARIKSQTVTVIKKNEESEDQVAGRRFAELVFANHPYAKDKEGTLESVENIRPQDLHKFTQGNFAKDNIIISIVGDIDEAGAKEIITAITENMAEKSVSAQLPEIATFPAAQVVKVKMDNPQTYIIFGAPGIKRSDPDYYAAYLLNDILGGGRFSARLMKEVREKSGLAYSIGTDLEPMQKADLLLGIVSTRSAGVDKTIRLINQEFAKIAKNGVSARELQDAKDFITGSFGLNLDKNENLAAFLINMQLYGLGADYLNKRNSYFKAVTVEQVNKLAKTLIAKDKLVFVRVGK